MSRRFSILFVCTANQCRSPMADRLATVGLSRRLGRDAERFKVFGAGTRAVDGIPITPMAATVLGEQGVEANGYLSSELRIDRTVAADLVLTLERRHRRVLLTLLPGVAARVFTLAEFARVARTLPSELDADDGHDPQDPRDRARAVVAEAARLRDAVRPDAPEDDDIPDPIGQPIEIYRAAVERIGTAVESTLTALTGRP